MNRMQILRTRNPANIADVTQASLSAVWVLSPARRSLALPIRERDDLGRATLCGAARGSARSGGLQTAIVVSRRLGFRLRRAFQFGEKPSFLGFEISTRM